MVEVPLNVKKVNQLNAAATLSGTDKVPIMQGANTVQTNLADIKTFSSSGGGGGGITTGGQNSRYYPGYGYFINPTQTYSVTANRLYAKPYSISESISFTKIGINVTTAVAGNARLGIYTWANGLPGSLVADLGTVSTTTTGDKEISITQTLAAGAYALVAIFDATPVIRGHNTNPTEIGNYLGWDDSSGTGGNPGDVYESRTYGALPATFGTPVYEYVGVVPGIWLRK